MKHKESQWITREQVIPRDHKGTREQGSTMDNKGDREHKGSQGVKRQGINIASPIFG